MATFVTEMQTVNADSVQGVNPSQNSTQGTPQKTQTVTVSQQQPQTQTTIIQPAQAHTGQQFIVTISGDQSEQSAQESVQLQNSNQTVYPHVQYVEGSDSPALYAATNGQMQNYTTDYGQATMYTQVAGSYYQPTQGGQMASITPVGSLQGQILTHQGGTYLVSGGTMDGEGHPIAHTTRASPATVQWLVDNFEGCEGVSLPRCTLYNLYLRHCSDHRLDAINPASFGKLVRSVFLGLRTRRLGTSPQVYDSFNVSSFGELSKYVKTKTGISKRGNSKYHYYGIRIKATSPLNQYTDDQTMAMRQQPINQGKRFRPANTKTEGSDDGEGTVTQNNATTDATTTQQHQHQQFLGDASGALPNFGSIDVGATLPEGITVAHIHVFEQLYKEHCEGVLEVVVNLQFSLIEALWQSFWRSLQADQQSTEAEYEKRLPKEKLVVMCKMEAVQKFVRQSDYAFYQALVEVLIPDVLRPIPSSLTQAIRNFAKSLETWLKSAMTEVPEEMIKTKVGAVSAFAQTLRRYTSLNHLAQAARAVLQNTSQINQMLTDLNRVDFANVQEQASWVCQCDDAVVTQLELDFKKTLQQQNSLEQWSVWLESVVNQVLKPHEGSGNFPKAARQFLLKWSFYSSMVIRDLTLRSAASFGSFHLIRLLYDEYMFYLVEHKVAAATGETPIAVMGEFIDLGNVMAMGTLEADSPTPTSTSPTNSTSASTTVSSPAAMAPIQKITANSINNTPAVVTGLPAPSTPTTNAATMALVAAAGQGTKTIVVVPVSSHGSGDAQPAVKRLKPN